jgi:hypothetical protein
MYSKRIVLVAVIIAVLTVFVSFEAKAEPTINDCVRSQELKSMAVGAAYGLTLGGLFGAITVVSAPAGAIASPVAFIASSTLYSGAIGLGATSASKMYDVVKTDTSVFYDYCVKQKALGLWDSAKKSLKEMAPK